MTRPILQPGNLAGPRSHHLRKARRRNLYAEGAARSEAAATVSVAGQQPGRAQA